jgi:hypothetical protein
VRPRITISKLTEAERGAHEALVQSLGPNALWREYIPGALRPKLGCVRDSVFADALALGRACGRGS